MHVLYTLLPALAAATSYRGVGSDQSPLGASLMQSNNGENAGNAAGDNECGVSTFKDAGAQDDEAPYVADCKAMLDTIRGDQDWPVTSTPKVIVSHKSCGFQVSTRSNDPKAEIGNADIIDLCEDSIKKFEQKDVINCEGDYICYVSAEGTMPCEELKDDEGEMVQVMWKIVKVD